VLIGDTTAGISISQIEIPQSQR